MTYTISGWLGGTKTSAATLTAASAAPVAWSSPPARSAPSAGSSARSLQRRTATGALPAGAVTAQVTLTLATTLTDINGPDAPQTGYDYATAGAT